ncbi:LysR family transcriptional regulator [Ramlibacter sp. AW1]|uniref:LysR family transcriptional regulator n=1 Tax=Ramlibacter aurantiacus TaxID=2801330 RepID=A0A936ZWL8_9BURK|nr:LysR family transcriptional regulator [Ramlibacter aurantiacus]
MKPDTLRSLSVFVEVAKLRSFTRAGLVLGCPKSTVSRRVAALEQELGLKLLKRSTQRVELTEEGQLYFERCKRLLQDVELAHEDLGRSRLQARGLLRVVATADFGLRLVARLPQLRQAHPALRIEFDFTSRRVDPQNESCDVAIYIGEPVDSGATTRRLGSVFKRLYASPDYLAARGTPTVPDQLTAHECIREARFDGKGIETLWTLRRQDEQRGVPVTGALSMNSIGMIRRLAVQALGIAALPPGLCREEVSSGQLVPVLPEWATPSIPIHALTAGRVLPARTMVFLDFVRRQLVDLEG